MILRLAKTQSECLALIKKYTKKLNAAKSQFKEDHRLNNQLFNDAVLLDSRLTSSIKLKEKFLNKFKDTPIERYKERLVIYEKNLPTLRKQLDAIRRVRKRIFEDHLRRKRYSYVKITKPLYNKINNLKRSLKKLKEYQLILDEANKKVLYFYNIDIKNSREASVSNNNSEFHTVTKMFCTYCISKGVPSWSISLYIGWRSSERAGIRRMEFLKEIKKDHSMRDGFIKYKNFMNQEIIDTNE